jgi:glycosyltransferase involved in cell wall biosynthesis
VHFHGAGRVTVLPLLVARVLGLPTLAKLTNIDHDSLSAHRRRRGGKLLVRVLRFLDMCIAISPLLAEDLSLWGWPKTKALQIPNPVDTDKFCPAEVAERASRRQGFGFADDEFIFLFIGILQMRKGLDTLAAAWIQVTQRLGPKAKLVLVGPHCTHETELMQRLSILPNAVLTGRASQGEVRDYLRAADAFVFPTRSEGLGNAVLEAMACELPCIATRIEGITDYMLGGGRGILVDPESSESLANAMVWICENKARSREYGQKARVWAVATVDTCVVARQYASLYMSLLARK